LAGFSALAFAASACAAEDKPAAGQSGGSPSEPTAEEVLELTVAVMPIADCGAYFYAEDTGLFDDYNLKIVSESATGGSAAIAAMAAGDYDVVYSGTDGSIKAFANGLPVKVVSGANFNQAAGQADATGLVVAAGIADVSQLAGATIGTNALGNINQVFAQEFLASQGVEDVQVVEIPFPEQVAALEAGQIKATLLPEPFASQAVAAGGAILGYPYRVGQDSKSAVGVYVSTDQVLAEKSEAVNRFVEAMTAASAAANDPANHDAVVKAILAHTQLSDEVVESMVFVEYSTDADTARIQAVADLLTKFGVLPDSVDVTDLVAPRS
jgi:NitT/TauT family transport system substrate-binding protein